MKTKRKKAVKTNTNILLKEIRDCLYDIRTLLQSKETEQTTTVPPAENKNEIIVTIPPDLTMRNIRKMSKNQTSKNTPLFYSEEKSAWYSNEEFYHTEVTRGITVSFSKTLLEETRNKTWYDQEAILEKHHSIRLSAPEILYILYIHEKETGERLLDGFNYYWTSSRSSDGGFVNVGDFASEGVHVDDGTPDRTDSYLGACLSRRVV